jgi:uncharacterized protein YfkK (UPF0435 family)
MIVEETLKQKIVNLEERLQTLNEDVIEAYMQGSDILWDRLKKMKARVKTDLAFCRKIL